MLDALTLDQMRTFVTVAEAGSFRAAAGRLSRVQSGVSHAIANLEAQLGVSLFDRSGHRPALTPEGRALLADTRAILLKVDSLRARARGLGEGVELSLSIAVDALFPLADLAAALGDLRRAYPSVGVRVWVAPLGGPRAALSEKRCTFGVAVGDDIPDPHVELEALSSVTMIAIAAATHPLAASAAGGTPLAAAELADHLQIVVEDPSPLTEGRDFRVLSAGTWRVSDMATKHALILSGTGWGTLPSWLVEGDLADGRLVRVAATALGRQGETVMPAYLARRTDQAFGPAAQALRQALRRRAHGSDEASVEPTARSPRESGDRVIDGSDLGRSIKGSAQWRRQPAARASSQ